MQWGTYHFSFGMDIGIIPGGWVVAGGKQFYADSDTLNPPSNICLFMKAKPEAVEISAGGYPDAISLPLLIGNSAIRHGMPKKCSA